MKESTVEAHLRRRAIAEGALVRKMIWPGHRGAPDRLVIWANRVSAGLLEPSVDFVELKRPGGKPDPHQEREHQKLRDHGCSVYVLDSIEAVDAYINKRKR